MLPKQAWLVGLRGLLAPYRHAHSLRLLVLGFSAGLPLFLVLGTLSFWLREAGTDLATIGHLSWVALTYAAKPLWAPLVDRLPLPCLKGLGRRRSWLLLAQSMVMAGLIGMAFSDPKVALEPIVFWALVVAFGSATQDIALDALRVELASADQQAALSACYQMGYRIAMIWSGAGVLWMAAHVQGTQATGYDVNAWRVAYAVMAGSMLAGVLATLFTPEPVYAQPCLDFVPLAKGVSGAKGHRLRVAAQGFQAAVVAPFTEFFERMGRQALAILGLIAIYRISDVVMGVMAGPFYIDMGYTKSEIASVTKIYGVVMTMLGALVGGMAAPKLGIARLMMWGAVLSAGTNLLYVWLGKVGHDVNALIVVVSADNLAGGLAGAAFVAYLSGLTNRHYTATQYALFSSLMLLLPKVLVGFSGDFVQALGYPAFFTATALLGLPVCLLVRWAARIPLPSQCFSPDSSHR